MKTFSLLVLFVVASLNFHGVQSRMTIEQIRNTIKGMRKSCVPKIGVAEELVDNTANGDFAEDPKLKCYFKCVLTMLKGFRNNELRGDVMKEQADLILPQDMIDRAKSIIDKCVASVTSSDPCEITWQFAKCSYEADTSMYFLS